MGYLRRSWSFLSYIPQALFNVINAIFKREGRPNIVYASSTPLTVPVVAYALKLMFGIPYIFEAVDVWPQVPIGMNIVKNKQLGNTLHYFTDILYKHAAHIVTLSEGMKLQILERKIAESRISVVHNGTNTSVFFPNTQVSKDEKVFIYAGSLGVANNVDFLLDAAKIVGGRWWIYGDGSRKLQLLEQAKTVNASMGYDCVNIFLPVPKYKLNDILNRANVGVSVFANYSVLEANAANKFYDYLAAGLPVLTNYRGWQADVLEKYNCGYAAKQGDLNDFVYGAKLLANSVVNINARRAAMELFDRKYLANKALDILIAHAK